MKRLNFTFASSVAAGVETPGATAFIELTEKQFENFFQMREIAVEKNLTAVELFIHGVQWDASPPPIETADFVISRNMGVALKAYPLGWRGRPAQSGWIDWGTLDLLYVLGNSVEMTDVAGNVTKVGGLQVKDHGKGVSNGLQLV